MERFKHLDCSTIHGNELKTKINELLDDVLDKKIHTACLTHIVSNDFLELYNLDEPNDINGWCCDWWDHMSYKNTRINIYGEAFYGNIQLSIANY